MCEPVLGLKGRVRDSDDVRARLRALADKRARRDDEFAAHAGEAERLIEELGEFEPMWRRFRVVERTVEVETTTGSTVFRETIVLPDVKHNFDLVLSMLNYFRAQKELPEAQMPLFVQPDEIGWTYREGVRCHCDEERSLVARGRSLKRAGRRGIKRWQKLRWKVLDRDDWKCQVCGIEKDVHVHRRDPDAGDRDVAAYVTLCRTHHLVPAGPDVPDPDTVERIRSQLAVVFQHGRIDWAGFVFGGHYYLLRG